jgi:hypothetical protein
VMAGKVLLTASFIDFVQYIEDIGRFITISFGF